MKKETCNVRFNALNPSIACLGSTIADGSTGLLLVNSVIAQRAATELDS